MKEKQKEATTKDYQILKETINKVIIGSSLNVGAVYFILKDIFIEIENLYYARINQELAEDSAQNSEELNCVEPDNIENPN